MLRLWPEVRSQKREKVKLMSFHLDIKLRLSHLPSSELVTPGPRNSCTEK